MNDLTTLTSFLFGDDSYLDGGRYGPVAQPQFELVLVNSGSVSVTVDEQAFEIKQGFAALVLGGSYLEYEYAPGLDTHVSWCEATLPADHQELSGLVATLPDMLPVSARMKELHRMGIEASQSSGVGAADLLAALGRTLFQEYVYQAHRQTRDRPLHPAVLRARDFMDRNATTPMNLSDIANEARLTPQHLTRLFRKDMGQTPVRYLWVLRARKGLQMLRRSGLSVAEVAFTCGYENPNHFSRHIKEQFGASPSELREQHWRSGA